MVGALWLSRYFYHTNQLLHFPGFSLLYFRALPVKHADLGFQLPARGSISLTRAAGWVSRDSNRGKMGLELSWAVKIPGLCPTALSTSSFPWHLWQQPRIKSSFIQSVILPGFSVRSIFHSWHCFYATNVRVSAKYVWLLSFYPPFPFKKRNNPTVKASVFPFFFFFFFNWLVCFVDFV